MSFKVELAFEGRVDGFDDLPWRLEQMRSGPLFTSDTITLHIRGMEEGRTTKPVLLAGGPNAHHGLFGHLRSAGPAAVPPQGFHRDAGRPPVVARPRGPLPPAGLRAVSRFLVRLPGPVGMSRPSGDLVGDDQRHPPGGGVAPQHDAVVAPRCAAVGVHHPGRSGGLRREHGRGSGYEQSGRAGGQTDDPSHEGPNAPAVRKLRRPCGRSQSVSPWSASPPRSTTLRLAGSRSSWASFSCAPATLTCSVSTLPSRPSRSISAMRTRRLSRTSTCRSRWTGSGQSIGQRTQASFPRPWASRRSSGMCWRMAGDAWPRSSPLTPDGAHQPAPRWAENQAVP